MLAPRGEEATERFPVPWLGEVITGARVVTVVTGVVLVVSVDTAVAFGVAFSVGAVVVTFSVPAGAVVAGITGDVDAGEIVGMGVCSVVNIVVGVVVFWLSAEIGITISAQVRRRISKARLFFTLEPPEYQCKRTDPILGKYPPKKEEGSHVRDQMFPYGMSSGSRKRETGGRVPPGRNQVAADLIFSSRGSA
jgi:hypothetical protein